jgi:thymidylate synthase (FAD)
MTRPSAPAMDALLNVPHKVLDHGFVRVVDYMGDDSAIVQAARVSYGAGTKTGQEDDALIHYLMRHRHTTPFEMCEIKLHVKLPIFVARQWVRHRTASLNEVSARYSVLDREFYIPRPEDIRYQSRQNKQGGAEPVDPHLAEALVSILDSECNAAFTTYDFAVKDDIARETARIGLPLSTYTQWYWKVDLHNLFNFLALRADPHAQSEIRAYADILLLIAEQWVPVAAAAFREHRLCAVTFSASAMDALRDLVAGRSGRMFDGLPKRERDEALKALGLA